MRVTIPRHLGCLTNNSQANQRLPQESDLEDGKATSNIKAMKLPDCKSKLLQALAATALAVINHSPNCEPNQLLPPFSYFSHVFC